MDSSLKETIYVSGLLLEKADNMATVAPEMSMAVSILQRVINDLISFVDGRDIPERLRTPLTPLLFHSSLCIENCLSWR